MDIPEIQKKMAWYVGKMEINDRQVIFPAEAEQRASLFLAACALCIDWRQKSAESLHEAKAFLNISYRQAISRALAKSMAEKTVIAEADPEYINALKKKDDLESTVEYFHTYYQLFTNSHIFYRQQASQIHKESNNGL